MSDFSQPSSLVLPPLVSTATRWGGVLRGRFIAGQGLPAVVTWIANMAEYMPIYLPWPYPVTHVFWCNGSTITTSNVDFGIYNADNVRLYSTGSTAMVGASIPQQVAVSTPFILPPGMYYLAWACDNTTSRAIPYTIGSVAQGQMMGLLEEASAFPLPATMTPVAWTRAWASIPCGIARFSPGF